MVFFLYNAIFTEETFCYRAGAMFLILDGNTEIGAHVWSDLSFLICVRYLSRSRTDTNLMLSSSEKNHFPSYVRNLF